MAQTTQIIEVEDDEDESEDIKSPITILKKQDENVKMCDKFLIIEGLPQPLFRDLREIICNIGKFYDVKLSHNDIECAYLVIPKNNENSSTVLTKFSNELMYGLLMGRHFSSKKKLVPSSIGLTGNSFISMSDRLTPSNRNLIKLANELFRTKEIRTKKKKNHQKQNPVKSKKKVQFEDVHSFKNSEPEPEETVSTAQKPSEENDELIDDASNSECHKFRIESVYSLQNGEHTFRQTADDGFIIEELYSSPDDSSSESEDRENESFKTADGKKELTYKELLKTVYNRELRVIVERLDLKSLPPDLLKTKNSKLNRKPPLLLKRKKASLNKDKDDITIPDLHNVNLNNRKSKRKSALTKRFIDDEDLVDESDKYSSVSPTPLKREKRTSVLPKKLEEFVCHNVGRKSYSLRKDPAKDIKRRKTYNNNNFNTSEEEEESSEEEDSSSSEEWIKPPAIKYPNRRGRPPKKKEKEEKKSVVKRKPRKKLAPKPPDILENLKTETNVTPIKNEPLKNDNEIESETESNPQGGQDLFHKSDIFTTNVDTNPQFVSSNQLIEHLRVKKLFDSNIENLLLRNFSGVPGKVILKHKESPNKFTSVQNNFAMTLFLFAPRAYKFLREVFCLPETFTLSNMMDSCRGEPGFLSEVLDHIKVNFSLKGLKDFCLLVERVPLKKGIFWDTAFEKFYGYVESCPVIKSDDALATESLVVFANSMNTHFRMPIAYFLVDSVCPGMVAKIIDLAVGKMHQRGAKVWSVTLEASEDSLDCARQLGCPFNSESVETLSHFYHLGSRSDVYILFDTYHLLKVARNVLAEKEVIVSPRGSIDWHYIKSIKNFNINGSNPNIYLNLNDSVAVALDSLRNQKVTEFLGSEPTSEFIKILNMVHNIANSSNPFSSGYSKPIFDFNIDSRVLHLKEAGNYLMDIIIDGVPIAKHNRKLFVSGFLLTINSIIAISVQIIKKFKTLKYICTNVFSLDHIDSFYADLIFQENVKELPSTSDFKRGIKNCLRRNLDTFSTYSNYYPTLVNFRSEKRSFHCIESNKSQKNVLFYVHCLAKINLQVYTNDILNCLANTIVVSLVKRISCSYCVFMLQKDHENLTVDKHDYAAVSFSKDFKNKYKRRGICKSSLSFYRVLDVCENVYRCCKITEGFSNLNTFTCKVVHLAKDQLLSSSFYPFMEYKHPVSEEISSPIHEYQLVDLICKEYVNIRVSPLKFSFSNFF